MILTKQDIIDNIEELKIRCKFMSGVAKQKVCKELNISYSWLRGILNGNCRRGRNIT